MPRPSPWRSPWLRAGLVAVAVVAYILLKALSGPPGDDAIEVVPRSAYVYVHVDLDRGSDQYEKGAKLAAGFPGFSALVQNAIGSLARSAGRPLDYEDDVEPWLGDEAALALVPSSRGVAGSVAIVASRDRIAATRFLDRLGRTARAGEHRGVPLRVYGRDFVAAFAGDLLLIGQRGPVQQSIDTWKGRVQSLASNTAADDALDPLPDDRLAYAYASEVGVERLLARQRGFLGQLGLVLSNPALRSAALAVVAKDDGAQIVERSSLDPKQSGRSRGIAALPPFKRTLGGELPKDSLLYLGLNDLYRAFGRFEDQVRVNAPAVARGLDRFLRRIRSRGGVDVRRRLLPLLRGEAAFWVQPGLPLPVAGLLVEGVDEKKAKDAMARLQGPLARSVNTRRGRQAVTFKQRRIEGVDAFSIRLSPAIDLTYAVFDGKLVIGTAPGAVRQVKESGDGLPDAEFYGETLGKVPERASSVLFLNLDRLLGLAERAGLGADPGYADVRDDLRRLKALGATVRSTKDHSETRIAIAID
jgi:Protein of unknown function (DUF3352)